VRMCLKTTFLSQIKFQSSNKYAGRNFKYLKLSSFQRSWNSVRLDVGKASNQEFSQVSSASMWCYITIFEKPRNQFYPEMKAVSSCRMLELRFILMSVVYINLKPGELMKEKFYPHIFITGLNYVVTGLFSGSVKSMSSSVPCACSSRCLSKL
jgi:hypothetical protein